MRKVFVSLAAVVCLAAPWTGQAEVKPADDVTVFQTLFAVKGPFRGPNNALRGIPGAVRPRVIDEVRGEVKANGHVKVIVRGLVLANHPDVLPADHGFNPHPYFRAVVSCLSVNDNGNPTVVNVRTRRAAANILGDAAILDDIDLPRPCVAPIVFVTAPRGQWLAASGR